MAAPIAVNDFFALFIKKFQVLSVKIAVAKQENEAKMAIIENEFNQLLQTLELYHEEAKKPGFLESQKHANPISSVDVNKQPNIKVLSLTIKEFNTHLETQLSPEKLAAFLESHFPDWVKVSSFISKELDRKVNKAKQENDDFLESYGEEEENGVLKFESIEEENNLKVPLIHIITGARSKRKNGGTNNKKRNKPFTVDDSHVESEDEESNQKKRRKQEDEDDCEEVDSESEKNIDEIETKKGQKNDPRDNPIRKQLIKFIEKAWVHLGFDTFGAGDLHTVKNHTPTEVQSLVGIYLHQFLTKNQKTIKFLQSIYYDGEEGNVSNISSGVDLPTVDGKILSNFTNCGIK